MKKQAHITIQVANGDAHVLPASLFQDVVDGKTEITNIDNWQEIYKVITGEWLAFELGMQAGAATLGLIKDTNVKPFEPVPFGYNKKEGE